METPKIVWDAATNDGCNSVQYLGMHNDFQVFGMSTIGEDGLPEPTGLPNLILLKDGKTKIVRGEESMHLLKKLNL